MVQAIDVLANIVTTRGDEIKSWLHDSAKLSPPFFYSSVDVRHAGYKIAPVDTNLFPAGFNNLSPAARVRAVTQSQVYFSQYHPQAKSVLILAEDHTRNLFYLDHLANLRGILEEAGMQVWISNLAVSEAGTAEILESKSGHRVEIVPVQRQGDLVKTLDGQAADFILVNNDLTSGAPKLLKDVSQMVMPPVGFGWYQRSKTSHFETYKQVVKQFCHRFDCDPWLLMAYFSQCGVVNFKERKGIECVARNVEKLLLRIREKYEEYEIKEEPYVFVKADRGTYGMGVMTARSGDDIIEMGKNIRKKMNVIKGGTLNTEVIIQEGVPTVDQVDGHPAEAMIYLVGGKGVSCIQRYNTLKDHTDNLNAKGMQFTSVDTDQEDPKCASFFLIAELASQAAAWECYGESYEI